MASLWDRQKHNLFKYGFIYANMFGLVVINYQPHRPTNNFSHRIAVIYSHVFSAFLNIVLPIYFVSNIDALTADNDQRANLLLLVSFANTLVKYVIVVVSYIANFVHYDSIRAVFQIVQQLEAEFRSAAEQPEDDMLRLKFEHNMFAKFFMINAMMAVQVANIVYQHYTGAHPVRVHVAIYTFVLWNYTENMANYFFYVNGSALRFYRLLNQQLREVVRQAKLLHYFRLCGQRNGTVPQLCCLLCERLDILAERCKRTNALYADSLRMHQFQILGIVFMTLISNITNFFTLFNLLGNHAMGDISPAIFLNVLHALVFYLDTYVVTLVSDNIAVELQSIGLTMRQFSQLTKLDVRLEQSIETFVILVLRSKTEMRICGLFVLDKRLTYITAATGLSYFITLVQFHMTSTA